MHRNPNGCSSRNVYGRLPDGIDTVVHLAARGFPTFDRRSVALHGREPRRSDARPRVHAPAGRAQAALRLSPVHAVRGWHTTLRDLIALAAPVGREDREDEDPGGGMTSARNSGVARGVPHPSQVGDGLSRNRSQPVTRRESPGLRPAREPDTAPRPAARHRGLPGSFVWQRTCACTEDPGRPPARQRTKTQRCTDHGYVIRIQRPKERSRRSRAGA